MDRSPYEAPSSDLTQTLTRGKDIRWLTNTLGVAVLLPGFLALLSLPLIWPQVAEQFAVNPVKVGMGMVNGLVALIAGGLLIALRPSALPALSICFLLGIVSILMFQEIPNPGMIWSVPDGLGLAYAIWLWQRGVLRSRPNNLSKPTPLRGAA